MKSCSVTSVDKAIRQLTNISGEMQVKRKYRSVSQIRPPFCNLSPSTKRRGGLYAGCDNFSRDYALPSDKA